MTETWVYPPQQARSRRTLERLIDAASDLLEDGGIEDVAVADIAGRAGLSVGTFYRRFRDKDALLHVLDEVLWRETRDLASTEGRELDRAALGSGSIEELLRRLLEPFVHSYFRRRGVRRALLLRSRTDPLLRKRAADTERAGARTLGTLLTARPEFREWSEEDLAERACVLVVQLIGFLREAVLFRELQAVSVPSDPEGVLDAAAEILTGTIEFWAEKGPGCPEAFCHGARGRGGSGEMESARVDVAGQVD